MSAMTGAAPVPVPPPMPAVMNSMSAPSIMPAMRSRSSIAASRPISGRAPAPRPRVSVEPSCSCVRAVERFSACASVFAQMKSTPDNAAGDHVLDGVAAAAADADDLDDRTVFRRFVDDFKHGAFLSPVWISGIEDRYHAISWRSQCTSTDDPRWLACLLLGLMFPFPLSCRPRS